MLFSNCIYLTALLLLKPEVLIFLGDGAKVVGSDGVNDYEPNWDCNQYARIADTECVDLPI